MASLADYLRSTPGGGDKDTAFIDGVVNALDRNGVKSPGELVGADYADFSWPTGALNAAGQSMVRRALARAAAEHAASKVQLRAPRTAGRQSSCAFVDRPTTPRQQRMLRPRVRKPPPLQHVRQTPRGRGRQRQTPLPQCSLHLLREARKAKAPIMSTLALSWRTHHLEASRRRPGPSRPRPIGLPTRLPSCQRKVSQYHSSGWICVNGSLRGPTTTTGRGSR